MSVPFFVLRGHSAAVTCSAFAPLPSYLLVSCDLSGVAFLWNLHTHLVMSTWKAHLGQILYAHFLTQFHLLTMGRHDGICIWDLSGASMASQYVPIIPDPVLNPSHVPSLVTRMELLYSGFTPCSVISVPNPKQETNPSRFLIACPARDNSSLFDIYLLSLSESGGGTFSTIIRDAGSLLSSQIAFSSSHSLPSTVSEPSMRLLMALHWIRKVNSTCQTIWLATGYETGKVIIWEWLNDSIQFGIPPRCSPTVLHNIDVSKFPITALTTDLKGKVAAVGTVANAVWMTELFPLDTKNVTLFPIDVPSDYHSLDLDTVEGKPILTIAIRGDNKRWAWGRHDGRVTMYTRNGQKLGDLVYHNLPIRHVAYAGSPYPYACDNPPTTSPDQRWMIAVASDDKTISLWWMK